LGGNYEHMGRTREPKLWDIVAMWDTNEKAYRSFDFCYVDLERRERENTDRQERERLPSSGSGTSQTESERSNDGSNIVPDKNWRLRRDSTSVSGNSISGNRRSISVSGHSTSETERSDLSESQFRRMRTASQGFARVEIKAQSLASWKFGWRD
jgi:hypothetical protein